MKEVFIVGVNHCWQQLPGSSIGQPSVEDPKNGRREITTIEFATFDEFIRKTIRQNRIRMIVEEACGFPHLRMAQLAKELNTRHNYCDLSQANREALNIKTGADRENHWLTVLVGVEHFPVLMICGANHVESFSSLLRESKYQAMIIVSDYEKTIF